jgi:NitT/TauT family transport system ATP-binding protein
MLTPIGAKFLDADINGRKMLFNQQLQSLGIFKFIVQMLTEAHGHRLPEEIMREELVIRLPTEDIDAIAQTIIGWGRFAELIGYSSETEEVYLDEPSANVNEGELVEGS